MIGDDIACIAGRISLSLFKLWPRPMSSSCRRPSRARRRRDIRKLGERPPLKGVPGECPCSQWNEPSARSSAAELRLIDVDPHDFGHAA